MVVQLQVHFALSKVPLAMLVSLLSTLSCALALIPGTSAYYTWKDTKYFFAFGASYSECPLGRRSWFRWPEKRISTILSIETSITLSGYWLGYHKWHKLCSHMEDLCQRSELGHVSRCVFRLSTPSHSNNC